MLPYLTSYLIYFIFILTNLGISKQEGHGKKEKPKGPQLCSFHICWLFPSLPQPLHLKDFPSCNLFLLILYQRYIQTMESHWGLDGVPLGHFHFYYNLSRNSFYKQNARAGRVCLLGVINHAQRRMNKPLAWAIVAKEILLQSRASAWCTSMTHLTLGLRYVCQRNSCLDYICVLCFMHLKQASGPLGQAFSQIAACKIS